MPATMEDSDLRQNQEGPGPVSVFESQVQELVRVSPPGVWATIPGADQMQATTLIQRLCLRKQYGFLRWTPATGFYGEGLQGVSCLSPDASGVVQQPKMAAAELFLDRLRQLTQEAQTGDWLSSRPANEQGESYIVLVLQGMDRILQENSGAALVDTFAKLCDIGPSAGLVPILISKTPKYPSDFLGRFLELSWPQLSREEVIDYVIRPNLVDAAELDESDENLQAVYEACRGMPTEFIKTVVGQSLRQVGHVDSGFIAQQKASLLANQLGVTVRRPSLTFQDLGGLEGVKQKVYQSLVGSRLAHWIVETYDSKQPSLAERMSAACREFAAKRESWISTDAPVEQVVEVARRLVNYPPRGVLLYGVEGSGKSALAEATAGQLGWPLVSLQVSDFLNKFVGSSEENFANILRFVEKVSPCIFFIDEVEKMFAGAKNPNGSGVESHIQGQFLSWAQDQRCGAYIMMTCNDVRVFVDSPELIRSGRCDATFFFDIPTAEERTKIWTIYRQKFGIPESFETPKSEGWTGANVVECCRTALEQGSTLLEAARQVRPPGAAGPVTAKRQIAKDQQYLSAATGRYYAEALTAEGSLRARRTSRSTDN